jgi:hypothetical protein
LIENGVNPSQILILTFTRKASSEIVERVYSEIPSEEKIIGSTFHGWCNMILFKNSKYFNVRDYTVIDRDDQESIFKLIVAEIDEKFKELKLKVRKCVDIYSYGRNTKNNPIKPNNYCLAFFNFGHMISRYFLFSLIFFVACQQTPKPSQTAGHSCTPTQSRFNSPVSTTPQVSSEVNKEGMVLIPGGTFSMGGDDDQAWRDEYPKHEVVVDSFWMDVHEVTNAQFAAFVEVTGYVTTAEFEPQK